MTGRGAGPAGGMLRIANDVAVPLSEVELTAVRAQGAGGQNVNKVATAIQLRFDSQASSLPLFYRQRLLTAQDQRVSDTGVVVIKAQTHRSQIKNRREALERLRALLRSVGRTTKPRYRTRTPRSAQRRRLDGKTKRGRTKKLRQRPED